MTKARKPDCALEERLTRIDWKRVEDDLLSAGYHRTGAVLDEAECERLRASFLRDEAFRSRVDMQRHGFGNGAYAYFAEPLPAEVALLRSKWYAGLAPVAERWEAALGRSRTYPSTLAGYRSLCRQHGQTRPTPLLLRYEAGGYNRLHRDLYGDVHFPFQVTILLSARDGEFSGGEFLLVENLPRSQARGEAIALERGEAVVFPVYERPVPGARGPRRAQMRHGVSRIHHGVRYALGIIFHDAA